MADGGHFIAHSGHNRRDFPGSLALADPVRTAHTDNRFNRLNLGSGSAHQPEIRAQRVHFGCFVHHIGMRHIAVGENDLIRFQFPDQPGQFRFGVDINTVWV